MILWNSCGIAKWLQYYELVTVLQNNYDIAEQLWYCKFIFATLAKILKLSRL